MINCILATLLQCNPFVLWNTMASLWASKPHTSHLASTTPHSPISKSSDQEHPPNKNSHDLAPSSPPAPPATSSSSPYPPQQTSNSHPKSHRNRISPTTTRNSYYNNPNPLDSRSEKTRQRFLIGHRTQSRSSDRRRCFFSDAQGRGCRIRAHLGVLRMPRFLRIPVARCAPPAL